MSTGGDALARKGAARRRAELVSSLRRIGAAKGGAGTAGSSESNGAPAAAERCELCSTTIPDEHRHMIHLDERRILCVCDACWSLRSDDPELRPAGVRTVWLDDLEMPADLWARFEIPIGLAFFLRNGADDRVVALYPSPAGATESEIDPDAWNQAVDANPQLRRLEPDAEALIVNRLTEPHRNVIAPIDECYRLVGMIKLSWEGISGGEGPERAVDAFFTHLREREVAG